jgi:putative phosphoribosyl transferase
MRFIDRRDAGRRLAVELAPLATRRPVVVALPRGGVPVAFEIARALAAPLEILAVRKLGAPGNDELAVGAVAEDGTGVLDAASATRLGMTESMLDAALAQKSRELSASVERYRRGRPPLALCGRAVILVDDGLATGLTDLAALQALRKRGAASIELAVPVGARDSLRRLADEADGVTCLLAPALLGSVGAWYRDFAPVPESEVLELLLAAEPDSPR